MKLQISHYLNFYSVKSNSKDINAENKLIYLKERNNIIFVNTLIHQIEILEIFVLIMIGRV